MEQILLSGYTNLILKAYTDFEINGNKFKKGQIIALLQNVEANFSYTEINKLEKAGSKNLGSFTESSLTNISVDNVPSNAELRKLLFNSNSGEVWLPRIVQFYAETDWSKMALPTTKNIRNLTVYNNNNEPISIDYEEENRLIVGLQKGTYLIYYEEEYYGVTSLLNSKQLPYLTLEVIGYGSNFGNEDKTTIFQHIVIPRVSLALEPNLIFNTSINNFSLKFNVIDDKEIKVNYGVL